MDVKDFRADLEKNHPGLPFHEQVATLILGQWPRVSIHDPATYIKSIARVMSNYSDATVVACADPMGGIASATDKLPTMKQLGDWLSNKSSNLAAAEHYAKLPKIAPATKRIPGPPPKPLPNLFVAENIPVYAAMLEKHHETGGDLSYVDRRECYDGETRTGLWVPLGWMEGDMGCAAGKRWTRPPARKIVDGLGF